MFKNWIKKVSVVKFWNTLDIICSIPRKLVPGIKCMTGSSISARNLKKIKSHKQSFYAFLRRPYNEHLIQFSGWCLHLKYHFDACKLWSRNLVPSPGYWSRLLLLPKIDLLWKSIHVIFSLMKTNNTCPHGKKKSKVCDFKNNIPCIFL